MENYLDKKVILIGPGGIAHDYAKVLTDMSIDTLVLGRNEEKCILFEKNTGLKCIPVVLEDFLEKININDYYYIITVNTENLGEVLRLLISKNAKNILVEKPAGINPEDLRKSVELANKSNITPFVAYNRRFYTSFIKAQELIALQGGLLSFSFEFTEWEHEIVTLNKTKEALKYWLLGNSSHVIDIAFYLGGLPDKMSSFVSGEIDWHPSGAQFSGAGITNKGVIFSYQANWQSAGRWGVELNTKAGKLIFRPLEKLFFQKKGELAINEIVIDNTLDIKFKPGLYRQIDAFLKHDNSRMISLQSHYDNVINILGKINPLVD